MESDAVWHSAMSLASLKWDLLPQFFNFPKTNKSIAPKRSYRTSQKEKSSPTYLHPILFSHLLCMAILDDLDVANEPGMCAGPHQVEKVCVCDLNAWSGLQLLVIHVPKTPAVEPLIFARGLKRCLTQRFGHCLAWFPWSSAIIGRGMS